MSGGISFAGASGFAITGGNFGRARGDVVTINGGSTELLPFISTTHLIPGLMADIDSTSSQDDDSSGDEDDSSVQNTAFPGSQHPIPPSPSSDNRPTSLVPQTPPNSIASLESVNLLPPPSNTPGVRGLAPARMQTRTLETPPEPQHVRYTEVFLLSFYHTIQMSNTVVRPPRRLYLEEPNQWHKHWSRIPTKWDITRLPPRLCPLEMRTCCRIYPQPNIPDHHREACLPHMVHP
ncbi:hypothetical protein P691DRAFT_358467 [Macrolepiota fuliginosa MF-IS2]|uniref:Uncharacterized protein n=1 Tax=Macrolepiota fuliginosa MF-IS2 TaxID=1400762 RepID=A0A9P5X6B2_9AGAR|nr:hypothetical protein P691DRAFT_358467 [Macrolepiota fuliginosa MF-IS2]